MTNRRPLSNSAGAVIELPGTDALLARVAPVQTALVIDGTNRADWNFNTTRSALITIAVDTVLNVPANMIAGETVVLEVITSGGAQLLFQGTNIYRFNIGCFPYFATGITALEFFCDGTNMICTKITDPYTAYTPLEDSLPKAWYTTRKASAYTGTAANVTALNDFGSNAITATKTGTGNILLTDNAVTVLQGFDFGAANADRVFDLGTPNASSFMSAGAMTIMIVVKASTVDNVARVLFSWSNAFKDFYLGYNSSTTQIDAFIFDNITGTGEILANSPTIGTSATILTWVKNASGLSYLYSNGVQIGSATQVQATTGTATQCQIGNFNAGGLSPTRGAIGDIAIWNRSLPNVERAACELQLMSIYGIV